MKIDQLYQQALEHNDKVKQLHLENFKLKEQISVLQQEQYKTDSQIKLDKDIMDNNMLSNSHTNGRFGNRQSCSWAFDS